MNYSEACNLLKAAHRRSIDSHNFGSQVLQTAASGLAQLEVGGIETICAGDDRLVVGCADTVVCFQFARHHQSGPVISIGTLNICAVGLVHNAYIHWTLKNGTILDESAGAFDIHDVRQQAVIAVARVLEGAVGITTPQEKASVIAQFGHDTYIAHNMLWQPIR